MRAEETSVRNWLSSIECPVLLVAADPAPVYFTPELRDARLVDAVLALQDPVDHDRHAVGDAVLLFQKMIDERFWKS